MIETFEPETLLDMEKAKEAAELLHEHYPGHAWAVNVQGGALIIKNLVISSLWGMVLHMSNLHDANERKKRIVRSGGELLERAGWKRGEYQGQDRGQVEGLARGAR